MAIDFSLAPDLVELRDRVRLFMDSEVRSFQDEVDRGLPRPEVRQGIAALRRRAKEWQLWLPHMPAAYGGLNLGPVAMATVSAEAGRVPVGPFVLNCQAP